MSTEASTDAPPLWAVVVPEGAVGRAVADELEAGLGGLAEVRTFATPAEAADAVVGAADVTVVLTVLSSDVGDVDDAIRQLDAAPGLRDASTLLVTDRDVHDDVVGAMDADRLDAIVALPWTTGMLGSHARSQASRWLHAQRPGDPRAAQLEAEDHRPLELPASPLLRGLEADPTTVAGRLVATVEGVLGRRPRLRLPAGSLPAAHLRADWPGQSRHQR